MFANVYKNKKVIVTGHTGFKGSWLVNYLQMLGAKVYGISNSIPSTPSHFKVTKIKKKIKDINLDIREEKKINWYFLKIKPDYVFHLAAQGIVSKSIEHPNQTFTTNVIGTLNILNAIKNISKIKKITSVIITSDKCYENIETNKGYLENDRLGGSDPYSASKASAEILFKSYFKTFLSKNKNVRIASARAGNVIGGGDWASNRLIPDCVRACSKNKKLQVRNINSTRPWQHVLEILSGYLTLGYRLKIDKDINGESFNFGPNKGPYTVKKILTLMKKNWEIIHWQVDKKKIFLESKLLQLNINKAKKKLKWKPLLNIDQTVYLVVEWYKNYYLNKKILTHKQIEFFSKKLKIKL